MMIDRAIARMAVALLLLVLMPVGGLGTDVQAATTMEVKFAVANRLALWNDGSDSMTVKVKVDGPVARVFLDDRYSLAGGLQAGTEEGRIRLFDDGTHGDSKAGDDTYTRSGVRIDAPWDWGTGIWLELRSTAGKVKTWDWPHLGVVVLDRKHERTVTMVDGSMRRTGRIANLKVGDAVYKPSAWYSRRKVPNLREVSRRFYQRFPDRFDFISVWTPQNIPPGYSHWPVKNNVKGIGMSRFDGTRAYGSKGRLKGVNFLGAWGDDVLIHETLHQWAAHLGEMGLSREGHWWSVNVRGWEWGLGFQKLEPGRYRITWSSLDLKHWSHKMPWIELYLAGLAKRSEVPPITRLKGVDPRYVQTGQVVRPSGTVRKTIDQIVKRYGTRQPSFVKSKKDFRMATVFVTNGRFASAAEMAMLDMTMAVFGSKQPGSVDHPTTTINSWYDATRGRSHMNTTLGTLK